MRKRARLAAAALLGALLLAPPALADWHASGRFFYRDREQGLTGFTGIEIDRPARRVDVQVLDDATSAVLATGATALDGSYDVLVTDSQVRGVRVRFLTSSTASPGLYASVRSSVGNPQLYAVTSAAVPGHSPAANQDFGDLTALPGSGGEAFNLFDVTLNGLDFLQLLNGSWPAAAIVVYWNSASGDGTYYQATDNSIHLLGGEGYDDTVVAHEQGHFAAANFSSDDSPGGVHYIGDNNQDIRLAWSEGYATYFASSARRRLGVPTPGWTYYVNTTGAPGAGNLDFSYEFEGPSRGAVGAASEVAVQALLWDIVDDPGTADDSPGADDDPLVDRTDEDVWEVTRYYLPQPAVLSVSLEDFWDGWFRPGFSHGREAEMTATFDALRVEFRPDGAEADGTPAQARYIPADGSPQARTFYPAGDADYVWFPAAAGQRLSLETSDLYSDANTFLTVFDSLGTQLSVNDNRSAGDASSRIFFTAPITGRFFLRATHAADLGVYGSYNLRVFPGTASSVALTDVSAAALGTDNASGRGAAWADFDADGWLDLYVCNIGAANALFQNNRNGTFANRAALYGVALSTSSEGACFGDYDNDGDQDLYVATVGNDDALFRNRLTETGTPSFVNATAAAGITDAASGRTANWVDADRDGRLDLFVANLSGGTCKLWLNDGDGTFTDATLARGLGGASGVITSVWADYDRDGDDDVFLGVNGGASKLMRNYGNLFIDVGAAAGVDLGFGVFAADWGDFDADGWPDLAVAAAEGPNLLYRNLGDGTFQEVGEASGTATTFQSTAAVFADHDLDGDLDLYAANFNAPNQLFDNVTGAAFSVTGAGGLSARSRAAAWGDYDRDGDPDLFVSTETADALYRVDAPPRSWLQVDLRGRTSNRDGIGSVITVTAGGLRRTRHAYAGQGFGSQNSLRAEFGLGPGGAGIDSLVVDWPSRKRSVLTGLAANQILLVDEADAVEVPTGSLPVPALALGAPWPNPAGGPVAFAVHVPPELATGPVTLEIFSVSGRRIARPFSGQLAAGPGRLVWTLRDDDGAPVAPGLYIARLRAGTHEQTRKLAVLPATAR
jgi:hypothetical protein